MGLQRPRHRPALTDGRIDVGEKIGRVANVQIGGLAGVDHRSAADGNEAVEIAFSGEGAGGDEGLIGGFNTHLVVNFEVDASVQQRALHFIHRFQFCHHLIAENCHPFQTQLPGVVTDLLERSGTEAYRRRIHGKNLLVALNEFVMVTAGHAPLQK